MPVALLTLQTLSGNGGESVPKACGIPAKEFEKAFGDDFWDRPIEERFHLLLDRMLKIKPKQLDETKHSQNQSIHNRTKTRT